VSGLGTGIERLWGRARRVNPHAVDALLAAAFTAGALWTVAARVSEGADPYRDDDALGMALLLLQTLPIAARTAAPLAALAVSVAAIALHIGIGYEGVPAGTFSALVILYSAASQTDLRQSLIAALLTAGGIAAYFTFDRGDPGLAPAVTTSATYAAAWGVGMYVRSRRAYTNVVEERARLIEREREVREREAVADERARIARELHDVVGHALNLIVIQSGGAQRVMEAKPDLARDSLASIEATGRQALSDMERMLGMLRAAGDGDDGLSPQPGLGDVDALAARVSEAGLPVAVKVEGAAAELPASVDLSAYRIIQEALTNALKHAGPARAAVTIRYTRDGVDLEVVDDGRGIDRGEAASATLGGRGLIGMQERVSLFGGDFDAGPRPEGGFRVHAVLPLKATATGGAA
jgi:signal transduction histidine kinase